MNRTGVKVRWFRPLRRLRFGDLNHRTHRKVLITDEAVAVHGRRRYIRSVARRRGDETEWRDTHFRIVGPAVDGLRAAFLDNWAETDSSLYDATDRFPDQPEARKSGRAAAFAVLQGRARATSPPCCEPCSSWRSDRCGSLLPTSCLTKS